MVSKEHILSENELEIFILTNEGKNAQEIAEKLDRTPNYIRKTKFVIRKKIEEEFRKIANSLRLDLDLANISGDSGLMSAFDWVHNTKVYLIFTVERGIIAWWEHKCLTDECRERNKEMIDLICRERKIKLSAKETKKSLLTKFKEIMEIIKEKGEK
jgi:hypothetical protein